jgi:hypothetical protein
MARTDVDVPGQRAAKSEESILMAKIEQLEVEGVDDGDLEEYVLGQMWKEIMCLSHVLEMVFSMGGVVMDR